MNAASILVLLVVVLIIAGAAYGAYRNSKKKGCAGCAKRDSCTKGINVSFDKGKE